MSLSWHPIFFERCKFWRKDPKDPKAPKAPKDLKGPKALKKSYKTFCRKEENLRFNKTLPLKHLYI